MNLEVLSEIMCLVGESRVLAVPKITFEREGGWSWFPYSLMDDEWDEKGLEASEVIRRMVLVDSNLDEIG